MWNTFESNQTTSPVFRVHTAARNGEVPVFFNRDKHLRATAGDRLPSSTKRSTAALACAYLADLGAEDFVTGPRQREEPVAEHGVGPGEDHARVCSSLHIKKRTKSSSSSSGSMRVG